MNEDGTDYNAPLHLNEFRYKIEFMSVFWGVVDILEIEKIQSLSSKHPDDTTQDLVIGDPQNNLLCITAGEYMSFYEAF